MIAYEKCSRKGFFHPPTNKDSFTGATHQDSSHPLADPRALSISAEFLSFHVSCRRKLLPEPPNSEWKLRSPQAFSRSPNWIQLPTAEAVMDDPNRNTTLRISSERTGRKLQHDQRFTRNRWIFFAKIITTLRSQVIWVVHKLQLWFP